MLEEKKYVTNFTFPNGETFYVKDEIIPDLDQASLGQVLTKTGENQLGWRTPSGGEGGGSGGAVDSVNGKIGVVVLDASDVGAYSKPSGGIPKTDLASDVQTSLGKADTALQQHQSLTGYATETWVEGKGYQTAPFEIPISDGRHGNYTTTATAQEIYDNAENCVIVFGAREYVPTVYLKDTTNESIMIVFANSAKSIDNTLNFMGLRIDAQLSPERVTVIVSNDYLAQLPAVAASDNGKFLRVVNGAWAAETVQTWQGGSY